MAFSSWKHGSKSIVLKKVLYIILGARDMKIEQLPSGSYRVRKQINHKTITLMFDKKPTQAEVLRMLAERAESIPTKGSFESRANEYIHLRDDVISPSTVPGYESMLRNLPEWFRMKDISYITQADLQRLVSEHSANHAPKTVHNVHGFVSAVLGQFRPNLNINTTLPQEVEFEPYTPTYEDVKRILDASKDDVRYHIPFELALMGLRRSEICALTLDDIQDNILTINKAKVKDNANKYVIKMTKTKESTRKVYIPDFLVEEIRAHGEIFSGHPNTILVALNRYQDKLGIPRFRLHDCRHFFASYAHSQGVSDADILASGGWKTDHTMKRVYRHEMKAKEAQEKIYNSILG